MNQITTKIEKTPNTTLSKLIKEFNLPISKAALSKRLIKLDYTYKKIQDQIAHTKIHSTHHLFSKTRHHLDIIFSTTPTASPYFTLTNSTNEPR